MDFRDGTLFLRNELGYVLRIQLITILR